MSTITLTLSQGLGPCTTVEDHADWVLYVCLHIDEACGFDVDVEAPPIDVQDDGKPNSVTGGDDDQRAIVLAAVETLWDRACAENFGREVQS